MSAAPSMFPLDTSLLSLSPSHGTLSYNYVSSILDYRSLHLCESVLLARISHTKPLNNPEIMKPNPARAPLAGTIHMILSPRSSEGYCKVGAVFAVTVMVIAVLMCSPAGAAPVAVRAPEGSTHGYILVRSLAGETRGQGELVQVVKEDGLVESHLVFHFKDGSLHDEKVVFSQQRVFTLIRYQLVQRGPLFPEQIDFSIDRGKAEYVIRSHAREEGEEKGVTGQFDLPTDVYNGMFVVVLKNLRKGASETVSFLAFTPAPEIIKLELQFMGEQPVRIGDLSSKARHYAFKPEIGKIRQFFGKFLGKLPADFHYDCWITADEVPGFVQFEAPLQIMAPIMRFELISPRMTIKHEDKISTKKR